MTIITLELERFEKLEKAVLSLTEKLSSKSSSFEDLIEADELKSKLGNPHPSTWWRWEKKGLLGNPITLGTKKMYKLSEIQFLQDEAAKIKKKHS